MKSNPMIGQLAARCASIAFFAVLSFGTGRPAAAQHGHVSLPAQHSGGFTGGGYTHQPAMPSIPEHLQAQHQAMMQYQYMQQPMVIHQVMQQQMAYRSGTQQPSQHQNPGHAAMPSRYMRNHNGVQEQHPHSYQQRQPQQYVEHRQSSGMPTRFASAAPRPGLSAGRGRGNGSNGAVLRGSAGLQAPEAKRGLRGTLGQPSPRAISGSLAYDLNQLLHSQHVRTQDTVFLRNDLRALNRNTPDAGNRVRLLALRLSSALSNCPGDVDTQRLARDLQIVMRSTATGPSSSDPVTAVQDAYKLLQQAGVNASDLAVINNSMQIIAGLPTAPGGS